MRLLFLALAICLASGVKAQFSDSEQVYIYEYQYTINSNGVKTGEDNPNPSIEFVIFKKGCIGGYIGWGETKNSVRGKGGTSYYEEKSKEEFAKRYNRFYASSPDAADAMLGASLFVYDNSLSNVSTYTYRKQKHYAAMSGIYYGQVVYRWTTFSWDTDCYSFSTDKKEMIRWWTDKDFRHYYKLMDANAYKPNIDILW